MKRRFAVEKMRKLRARGLSTPDIAGRMGCTVPTVWRATRDLGQPRQRYAKSYAKMRALRARGLPYREIAERVGCSLCTAWRVVRDVEMRA